MRHSFIILCVAFSLVFVLSGCDEKELSTSRMTTQTLEEGFDTEGKEEEKNQVTFYICGQVKNPGVYTLPDGSRIEDAIAAAGGALEEAELNGVNLAKRIKEEEQIVIYAKGEEVNLQEDSKIRLNSATKELLMTLPGIGESKAMEIIAYREEHGGFREKEELMNISGIKEGTYNKIKDEIVLE